MAWWKGRRDNWHQAICCYLAEVGGLQFNNHPHHILVIDSYKKIFPITFHSAWWIVQLFIQQFQVNFKRRKYCWLLLFESELLILHIFCYSSRAIISSCENCRHPIWYSSHKNWSNVKMLSPLTSIWRKKASGISDRWYIVFTIINYHNCELIIKKIFNLLPTFSSVFLTFFSIFSRFFNFDDSRLSSTNLELNFSIVLHTHTQIEILNAIKRRDMNFMS